MQYKKKYPIPIDGGLSQPADWIKVGHVPQWEPDGPTLRFPELLKVIRVGRSKAYELARTDPTFPQGIPLFDTERSPRFWWTHEALAWVKGREELYKKNAKESSK